MLTNITKDDDQAMEDYLQTIKNVADSLVASRLFLTWNWFNRLLPGYITLRIMMVLTAYTMLPGAHFYDDLHSKLIFFEQRIKFTKVHDVPNHQAFAATVATFDLGGVVNKQSTTNNKGKNNGGRNFNKRGMGLYNKNNNRGNNR